MKKTILVVSPCPTHPQNSGSRVRIYHLVSALRDMGHDVYFLYENREAHSNHVLQKPDIPSMREYWGNRFIMVPCRKEHTVVEKSSQYIDRSIGRVGTVLKRISPRLYRWLKVCVPHQFFLPQGIDSWFSPMLDRIVRDLSQTVRFDAVFVEYVFLSKALTYFGSDVLKIIDTLDVFSNRHKPFLKEGVPYVWFATTAREETKGLKRADIVIAVQDDDKAFFSRLTDTPVVTLGHVALPARSSEPERAPRTHHILFCGASNPANIHGVRHFIRTILPRIQDALPDARLLLAGNICHAIERSPGIIQCGEVKDLQSVYDMADVVISPNILGTGLAVKSIDPLCCGKPVVMTSAGMRGLEQGAGSAFLVGDTPERFAGHVVNVLSNETLRHTLSRNAYLFTKRYAGENRQQLEKILSFESRECRPGS